MYYEGAFVNGQMLKAGRDMEKDERKYAIDLPRGEKKNF
jgi:hypothetical protein